MLNISEVNKTYNKKEIFKDLTIKFDKGICGLLGPNGAGKSTMIRMICGLEPPDSGKVYFDGEEIDKLGEVYRNKLGYVPQKAGYYPDFTAYKFLEYISKLKDVTDAKEKIMELLKEVGLENDMDRKLRHFSGGMKQRVSIAQSLLNDPEILILDEPTVGLDPHERLHFKNLISNLSYDKIIIFATHIVSDVEDIANRVVVLKQGKIQIDGSILETIDVVKDKVWEYSCQAKSSEINQLKKQYKVSRVKNKDGIFYVRIISNDQPHENAIPVEATLEEAYLSFFEVRG